MHRVAGVGLCALEAKVDECAATEFQQQSVGTVSVVLCGIESSRIEIVDVTTAAAAAVEAAMFERAVIDEMSAAVVVWWDDCEMKVVIGVCHTDAVCCQCHTDYKKLDQFLKIVGLVSSIHQHNHN